MADEWFKRIRSHRGVRDIVVVNAEGVPVRSTLADPAVAVQYAGHVQMLVAKAGAAVRVLDRTHPADELRGIRIRSHKHEIIIVAEQSGNPGQEYAMVIVQDASTALE